MDILELINDMSGIYTLLCGINRLDTQQEKEHHTWRQLREVIQVAGAQERAHKVCPMHA